MMNLKPLKGNYCILGNTAYWNFSCGDRTFRKGSNLKSEWCFY